MGVCGDAVRGWDLLSIIIDAGLAVEFLLGRGDLLDHAGGTV